MKKTSLYYKPIEQTMEMEKIGLKSGQENWSLVGPINIGGRVIDIEIP